jgi:hypothetical protein
MKEVIKENVVNAPTLFVGVGGTGSKIVMQVAEMCGKTETANVNFICLDTNVNDLGTIAKSGAQIYRVQTSNTQTVGNYLKYDDEARNKWFPKNAILYPKSVSEGAGQVRAISRLAMNGTIKTGAIKPLYNAVDDLFRKDGSEMKQALRIVIVSTASGGTGSGLLLPLSMYIRDYVNGKYPNTTAIVRMMILLPETLDSVIDSTTERESQRRNAYATIKELNAFMMKGSGFMEYNVDLQRYQDIHVDVPIAGSDELKELSLLPCDFCFLMDGQDAEDSTMVTKDQYMEQAARALYEQNIGPMQKDAFSVEDNIIKEFSAPGIYGRNRFGGIGASVVRYPYEQICDYIAYDWAIDSIGGEGEAAKWTYYDKKFELELKEAESKGLSEEETPVRAETYVKALDQAVAAEHKFSKDLTFKYLRDAEKRMKKYLRALKSECEEHLWSITAIKGAQAEASVVKEALDYVNDPGLRKNILSYYDALVVFKNAVESQASKAAESYAEGLFRNKTKTNADSKPYMIEALLKNARGEVCHPNAMRYMLYKLSSDFETSLRKVNAKLDEIEAELESYGEDQNDAATFDYEEKKRLGRKKDNKVEKNLKEFCTTIYKQADTADESQFTKLNELFAGYYEQIENYGNAIAAMYAYKVGQKYVAELSKVFESFYKTFGEKITAMTRQQRAIVEGLKFTNGNSVLNVCATEAMLKELSSTTTSASDSGSMLASELNGLIFDAVKENVAFEREILYTDVVEDDRRIDIFDDIILGYFKENVRSKCESIDMNIIEAIAMENQLTSRIKLREDQVNSGGKVDQNNKVFNKIDHDADIRHITATIARGRRLAAPSIQKLNNTENRTIELLAYNKSLLDMQNYKMSSLAPKGSAVDTISRYELHFFNALYNLTADKISKFACKTNSETVDTNAGLYHEAYVTYSKRIGPDSTKSDSISTHIDKRWDSLAAMPELDFKFQAQQIMKIHQAMIYGLVYNAITYRNYSNTSGAEKKVYKYENSSEYYEDLVVSNGTPCDEFFEILDSLYISPNIVEDIEIIKARKCRRDETRNSNYKDTQFHRELEAFKMKDHDNRTSLFEIPLVYYQSLPSSRRYSGEIAAMAEAVIQIFEDELNKWEKANDVPFLLRDVLVEQFDLLMDNYGAYDFGGTAARDNEAVDIIFRKLRKVLGDSELIDSETIISDMKKKIG